MPTIPPGELSQQSARELTRALGRVDALGRLRVAPPLAIEWVGDQPVIYLVRTPAGSSAPSSSGSSGFGGGDGPFPCADPLGVVSYEYRGPACRTLCYATPCVGYERRLVFRGLVAGCYSENYGPWVFFPGAFGDLGCFDPCVADITCSSGAGPGVCGPCDAPDTLTLRVTSAIFPGAFGSPDTTCFGADPSPYETTVAADPLTGGYYFDILGTAGDDCPPSEFLPTAKFPNRWGIRGIMWCGGAGGEFILGGNYFCQCGQYQGQAGYQNSFTAEEYDCGPPFYARYKLYGARYGGGATGGATDGWVGPTHLMTLEWFG